MLAGLLAVILVAVLLVALLRGGGQDEAPAVQADPGTTTKLGRTALRALRPDASSRADDLTRRAQAGFANPLYRQVPGGAVASAERVTQFRSRSSRT